MQERFTGSLQAVRFPKLLFGLILLCVSLAAQQFPVCVPNAGNANLRSEGLAEAATDITLSCSGAKPNVPATAILTLSFPNVNITNHLSTGNVPDVIVSVMAGGFQQPAPASIQLVGANQLNISGINYTPGTDGGLTIRISNVRLNVHSAVTASGQAPILTATMLATGLVLANTQVQLGAPVNGLLASDNSSGIFTSGSPAPASVSMSNLFSSGTSFTTTRVTEGFVNAFIPKDGTSDAGTRIMLKFTGLPPSTRLFVPDLVAGSSAIQQTSAGDLGVAQSAGTYASATNGSLLLSRVSNPLADGSGGGPFYKPPAGGTAAFTLTTAVELPVNNGTASVVYEAVDANPSIQESAQIPIFIALPPGATPGTYGQMSVTFAPLSTVGTATMTDPVPRFAAVTPPRDCTVIGDCSANYFPRLKLNTTSVNLTSSANGDQAVGYVPFINAGSGSMNWTASVSYQTGSGWLSISPTSGSGAGTVNVHANPANLAQGTYNATVTVDAGPVAGSQSVPVAFTVGQAVPLVSLAANAANGKVLTLTPGSFASIYGTNLSGSNVTVSFDGVAANLVYTGANQINLIVPPTLAGKTSAQMLVTVDGRIGSPLMVTLADSSPAIFPSGVLNQDNSVNSANKPAVRGSTLQIFLTGLPPVAGATVNIGSRTLQSVYSGGAPGVPGLQQVNVMLPADLTGTAQLTVCSSAMVCSPAYSVTIQ
jgi:uncharacterized protein (TIGR03437 family)